MSVDHRDFTIVRTYSYSPAQVFDAWADPEKKKLWFGEAPGFSDVKNTQDFREGGRDHNSAKHADGWSSTFDSEYISIVPNERIVYTYGMTLDGVPLSGSVTSVTFEALDGGTLMTFTEHGVFLDNPEDAVLREEGTKGILDAFGTALDDLYS